MQKDGAADVCASLRREAESTIGADQPQVGTRTLEAVGL